MADQPEALKLLAHKLPDYGGVEASAAPEAGGAEGADGAGEEPEEQISRVFPLAPFALLGPAQAFVPGTWRKIVSVPHLVLLVGILACSTMLGNTLFSWYSFGCRTWTCQGRVMPLLFVGFCLLYFVVTIQQYDDALQVKQRELQKLKRQCEQQYKETVAEMEGFLNRAMDNQVVLAERSFDSLRRDFSRFLVRYEKDASKEAGDAALPPFRALVLQWLIVFAECSIDPVKKPLKVLEAEELDQCKSVGEVALRTDERVKSVEVKFVTAQREKDKKELSRQHSIFKAVLTTQKADLKKRQTLCGNVPTFGEIDIEDGVKQTPGDDDPGEYRWVQWGRSRPLGLRADPETGSFPFELGLGFVTILLLSADHLRLILGFFVACSIVVFETTQLFETAALRGGASSQMNWLLLAQVMVCLVCIVFVLHQFLDMDIIQQLEGQLRELQSKKKQVDEKRERLVGFFEAVQQLADLWTHRTVTRLELLKHLQEKLRDAPAGDHALLMGAINEKVDTLESSIPALEQWANKELITSEKKKLFGAAMADLYKDRGDLQATLDVMNEASGRIKATLADRPATQALAAAEQATPGDISEHSPAAEDPHKPGDQVEYLSASQGCWVPATVTRRNPVSGLYDLDCKQEVPPEKIRAVAQSVSWWRW